ncbi:hypothetical protein SAMN05444413_1032 [Roseivivax marinus]|uniref:hypothetical protein n=1 Tax=Roseivivax marinus TaxID=1379903 RepID=UPI0008CB423F|nr:hypothetical protein [Roseivivax marinus]SEK68472.1 hypothetical protein SAMN05444413_1032 [Roseivivax marinus]
MYTPEGYYSFDDLCKYAPSWTDTICFRKKLSAAPGSETPHRRDIIKRLVSDGFAASFSEAEFCLEICDLWLVANILDVFEVTLCSKSGVRMRCPKPLTAHGDAFDWWSWPLDSQKFGQSETHSYLHFYRDGNFRARDAWARFPAIDVDSGVIALKANSRNLFTGSSYGHGDEEIAEFFIEKHARPYLGWGICISPYELPEFEEELFGALGFFASSDDGYKTSHTKPASTHQAVMSCVEQAFPDGKGKATWADVEAKVGYSRRTIVRALRQRGLYEDWTARGQAGKR